MTLHFSRIRPLGLPNFMDPQADICTVTGRAISAVLADIQQASNKLNIPREDIQNLIGLLEVFSIRLRQDTVPLAQQMKQFAQAYNKLPTQLTALFMQLFGYSVFTQYALFMRRDARHDQKQTVKILPSVLVLTNSFAQATPQALEAYDKCCKSLVQDTLNVVTHNKSILNQMRVDAVTDDGSVQFKNIKATAFKAVGGSITDTWQTLSQKCAHKLQQVDDTSQQAVALALAYPSYKYPFLDAVVEVSDESKCLDT